MGDRRDGGRGAGRRVAEEALIYSAHPTPTPRTQTRRPGRAGPLRARPACVQEKVRHARLPAASVPQADGRWLCTLAFSAGKRSLAPGRCALFSDGSAGGAGSREQRTAH